MAARVQVPFAVPREVAFDFLGDPHKRPQWQSTLRRVEAVTPMPPQVGTSWRDVVLGEVVAQMELTVVDRPVRWAERGVTKGVAMDLTLDFEETATGCLVSAAFEVTSAGAPRFLVAIVRRSMPRAVRKDLVRAAGILDGSVEPRDP